MNIRFAAPVVLLPLLVLAPRPASATDDAPTFPVDPVALVGGREVPGDGDLAVEHAGYRYAFASPESRAAFLADPARYEIQLGGACARMGPLSGAGAPELYAVHDGRIYVFASQACRRTFLERPEKLLEKDDPVPHPLDGKSIERGRALLARAVEGMGGAAAIDDVRVYEEGIAWEVEHEGEPVARSRSLTITFPDGVRREQRWGDQMWAEVANGATGHFESSQGTRTMHAQQRRALERIGSRNLLVILRSRHEDDFKAFATRSTSIDGRSVDQLVVAFGGSTCTLAIDPDTGRILAQRYLGRGPTREIGEIERTFSDFLTMGGITLARTVATRYEGQALADSPVTFTEFRIERN